ncbi:MAG: hypothetical protein A2084_00335 [Tenericutes bacterium GWC2_39_45]|nr:MAG: hypothetical protein A2084_00335 [Tenericutes bacterium GWC2_39_45]HBG32554.1 hypothetical protein [Acholeplasmataceae bacterium]HCB67558.1 hypothetical protein [Acholeplasmataceae bacterium]
MERYRFGSHFLKLSIFFFVLLIVNFVIGLFSYMFTFESWTPIPSGLFLFSLSGLTMYIFLMIVVSHHLERIFLSIVAIASLVVISIIAMFTAEEVNIYRQEGYVIYVQEYRFLFDGHDDLFLKENFIVAKKIGTGEQSEEQYSTYRIQDGILFITTHHEGGSEYTISIELNN